jgi:hypothetical protein
MTMPFTVNPGETQAMQEDQVQLMQAISQTARTTLGLLKQSPAQQKPESPEIRMNGRIVYGAMADGQIRNELTPERLQGLLDSLQQPKTEGVDPKQYKGKTAAIEIRDAGIILFRQEKDSSITVNQFQHQQTQKQSSQVEM